MSRIKIENLYPRLGFWQNIKTEKLYEIDSVDAKCTTNAYDGTPLVRYHAINHPEIECVREMKEFFKKFRRPNDL